LLNDLISYQEQVTIIIWIKTSSARYTINFNWWYSCMNSSIFSKYRWIK